jgi:hypothetical protein
MCPRGFFMWSCVPSLVAGSLTKHIYCANICGCLHIRNMIPATKSLGSDSPHRPSAFSCLRVSTTFGYACNLEGRWTLNKLRMGKIQSTLMKWTTKHFSPANVVLVTPTKLNNSSVHVINWNTDSYSVTLDSPSSRNSWSPQNPVTKHYEVTESGYEYISNPCNKKPHMTITEIRSWSHCSGHVFQ